MSATTQDAEQKWARFRKERDAALAEEHGWLSLTSLQWLPAIPAAADLVPGLWSARGATASLTAGPDDGLTYLATGRPVTGTITAALDDEESLMWVAHGGTSGRRTLVELARRAGRYAIRTRDSQSPTLASFRGVPVFGYRPELAVEARFEPYAEPLEEPVRTAHPAVPARHTAAGEVVFSLPRTSRNFRLRAGRADDGFLDITFHDRTNGVSTAGWRRVTTRPPGPDGSVVVDFNRAVNYPSAFTAYGTCPMPVDANLVDARIEAGEKIPGI